MSDKKNDPQTPNIMFSDLDLSAAVQAAIEAVGYESPSPIQAETIPHILAGKDILGMAQTGTGKTAAFALPLLSKLDPKKKKPQALVLAPTRELAIQVAEAFQTYASKTKGFHVLPVYGGQEYGGQIRALKRGAHVVVGTPGRVMDHIRKGTLDVSELDCLVLDEADEMLRMGFIDDVEWVLEQTPDDRQIALFSATMPREVRKIAQRHLQDPVEITIKQKTQTATSIRQRYWPVRGMNKLDALTRILETETFDAMIIFVRTKAATVELAEKCEARGFSASALNGDMVQSAREHTVQQLKAGRIDIVIATDVAARGLDVERITHVVNYDIPYDAEAYVHRIGRTGRAGRSGDAILFVAPREMRMLRTIEKVTRQPVEAMEAPSTKEVNNSRVTKFFERLSAGLNSTDDAVIAEHAAFRTLLEQYVSEHAAEPLDVAAVMAKLLHGDIPFFMKNEPPRKRREQNNRDHNDRDNKRGDRRNQERGERRGDKRGDRKERRERSGRAADRKPEAGMDRYRVAVGRDHDVKPGNIVGAIANEAGLDSQHIGRIDIYDDYTLVDLPQGMPKEIFNDLQNAWVSGQKLKIRLANDDDQYHAKGFKGNPSGKKDDAKRGGKKPAAGRGKTSRRFADKDNKDGQGNADSNSGGNRPPRRIKRDKPAE